MFYPSVRISSTHTRDTGVDAVNNSRVLPGVVACSDVLWRHLDQCLPISERFHERVRFPAAPPEQARPKGLACFVCWPRGSAVTGYDLCFSTSMLDKSSLRGTPGAGLSRSSSRRWRAPGVSPTLRVSGQVSISARVSSHHREIKWPSSAKKDAGRSGKLDISERQRDSPRRLKRQIPSAGVRKPRQLPARRAIPRVECCIGRRIRAIHRAGRHVAIGYHKLRNDHRYAGRRIVEYLRVFDGSRSCSITSDAARLLTPSTPPRHSVLGALLEEVGDGLAAQPRIALPNELQPPASKL
jgi:hypothetical protein